MKPLTNENRIIRQVNLSFNSLSIYRKVLEDRVIDSLFQLTSFLEKEELNVGQALSLYSSFFHELAGQSTCGPSLKAHILKALLKDDNAFSRACEASSFEALDPSLVSAASNDIACLKFIAGLASRTVKEIIRPSARYDVEAAAVEKMPDWSLEPYVDCFGVSGSILEVLSAAFEAEGSEGFVKKTYEFHNANGSGLFAGFKAFVWEHREGCGSLRGVNSPDPILLKDLVGYELERSEVINNTLQFLEGHPANNVLLYGDRGTGKSSTVKAILNEYHSRGLRLVEVPKMHLMDFPEIIRSLSTRKQKFIIFVDDLVFEDNEENYTALKAALEGGIEVKPSNVLIYATSNRRHLIKEKFSDRYGLSSSNHDDEVRAADTIQEKLSLSDRFGITVVFSSPDKQRYLEIVEGIASKRNLKVDKDYLHKEALKWELWYNGRSPRTARQFIDWLEGQGTNP